MEPRIAKALEDLRAGRISQALAVQTLQALGISPNETARLISQGQTTPTLPANRSLQSLLSGTGPIEISLGNLIGLTQELFPGSRGAGRDALARELARVAGRPVSVIGFDDKGSRENILTANPPAATPSTGGGGADVFDPNLLNVGDTGGGSSASDAPAGADITPGVDPDTGLPLNPLFEREFLGPGALFQGALANLPGFRQGNPIVRQALNRQFRPLFSTFVLDRFPDLNNLGQLTEEDDRLLFGSFLEDALGGGVRAFSPGEIQRRISGIGSLVGMQNLTGAQEAKLEPFLNDEFAFNQGVLPQLAGINPIFSNAIQNVAQRRFDRFRFNNPTTPFIQELARRGGNIFS